VNAFSLVVRLARRELRGGLRGLRIFLACLALGVAAIAAVGTGDSAIRAGLAHDARAILGGDVDLRLANRDATDREKNFLGNTGTVSKVVQMRAMARADRRDRRTLVELKAVDAVYPLAGAVSLSPGIPLGDALARTGRVWGAVAEQGVLDRLGVAVGDRLRVGDAEFELRAVIAREPDRGADAFSLGPRLMIAAAALAETGLVAPGSILEYRYRVLLPASAGLPAFRDALSARFPDAGWRVLDRRNAAPGLNRMLERVTMYLTLVGLTALLIGGVGVANAIKSYLDSRLATIATLKCLGASHRLVFAVYLTQVLALAAVGTAAGLVVGAAAPFALAKALSGALPFDVRAGLYAGPLALAGGFGIATALAFSLWPLSAARAVSPAGLFRSRVSAARARPSRRGMAAIAAAVLGLVALAGVAANDRFVALWFGIAAVAALLLLRAAAEILTRLSGAWRARLGNRGRAWLRLALANLRRPGAQTVTVMLSLGLGLVALIAVTLVEGNLTREVGQEMPGEAPAFFFIDIQPDQLAPFLETVRAIPGVGEVAHVPSLRGRIVAVNGRPVDQVKVAPEASWVTQGDRGLTYSAEPPKNAKIVAGSWWPADYRGLPLISFDAKAAEGMGIGVDDTLTINLLGEDIEARIANLRDIDWGTLGINFVIVFAPGALENAPQTHLATVRVRPDNEAAVEKAVTDKFPNVSAIRVREALEAVNAILGRIGAAVRAVALVTLAAGILALAGAVAAGHERRVYDAVVLKVLGARRRDVLKAFLAEYGLLGLATGALAVAIGVPIAYAVLTRLMHIDFTFLPGAAAATVALGIAACLAFGFAGTWLALGERASKRLRNE
jgi:putative ABC transport system permease protein